MGTWSDSPIRYDAIYLTHTEKDSATIWSVGFQLFIPFELADSFECEPTLGLSDLNPFLTNEVVVVRNFQTVRVRTSDDRGAD